MAAAVNDHPSCLIPPFAHQPQFFPAAQHKQGSKKKGADTTVHAGFFGRHGGISQGIFRGLNAGLGSNDDPMFVEENRRLIANTLSARRDTPIITPYQIHSSQAVFVDAASDGLRHQADAYVTKTPHLIIGVVTADCAPILFADRKNGVIAAAHAGWKGAIGGICQATVDLMVDAGADRAHIHAAIGPAIAQKSYEVDRSFYDHFCNTIPAHSSFFTQGVDSQHFQFDLEGFVKKQLSATTIKSIWCAGQDTYPFEEGYFSFRRTTHQKQSDYGRQLSAIMLTNS